MPDEAPVMTTESDGEEVENQLSMSRIPCVWPRTLPYFTV